MAYRITIDELNRDQWMRYAADFADYSIYQTWPYQEVRCEMDGQEVKRVIVLDGDEVLTMCQLRIMKINFLRYKIAYVQSGPLMLGLDGQLRCNQQALKLLCDTVFEAGVAVIRIAPLIWDDETVKSVAEMLCNSGFKAVPYIEKYHTFLLSLEGSEDQIRRQFSRSGRRDVKIAEKAGVVLKESRDIDSFLLLKQLYSEAIKRKGFKGLDPEEYMRSQKELHEDEKITTLAAYLDNELIGAHATSYLGKMAVNLYVAVNEKGLKCKASYLIWFRSFLSAKLAGMKQYDFGGIDPVRNRKVYEFKKRLGGDEISTIGTFDFCRNPVNGRAMHVAERVLRFAKRI